MFETTATKPPQYDLTMAVSEAIRNALSDYDVEREIGRGAMGVVYLGRHRSLDRSVAIKELPRSFAADPGVRDRFVTEARVLAGLDHPHIVPVYDFVDRGGQLLLVMQALPGGTVWEAFVERGLTMPSACAVTLATCAGLSHAHSKGVLHRDVKPENLMFDDTGSLKVTDFGIAKVVSGAAVMATIDGSILGTPAYMAPEQASGDPVSASADVYATGVMLFELLSGRLPFLGGDTPMAMLVQRISEDAPALLSIAPDVPKTLAAAVDRSIARAPADRFGSAEEFGVAIAKAAADAWGSQWLDAAGHSIEGSPALTAAIGAPQALKQRGTEDETDSSSPQDRTAPSGDASRTVMPGEVAAASLQAKDTVAPTSKGDPDSDEALEPEALETNTAAEVQSEPSAPETATPKDPTPEAPTPEAPTADEVIRPKVKSHAQGADLNRINPADVVAVSDVIKPPGFPAVSAAVAMLGILGAVLLGWFGIDSDAAEERGIRVLGNATAAGQSIIGDSPVDIELDSPIALGGLEAFDGNDARISFSVAGQQHVRSDSAEISGGTVNLEPGASKWVVAGASDATLEVLDPENAVLASQDFEVDATSPPAYLTVTGVGAAILALITLASLESNLRPLRRGRMRIGSFIGLAAFGALFGVLVVVAAAVLGGSVATITTLAIAGLLGALGWTALGAMFRRLSKRRRIHRRNARHG